MKKKILAFSTIRSDYDLMSPLYRLLHKDDEIDFKIIVSGAHLSKQFGYIFGYRLFRASLEGVEFKKDLIMSDVF